MNWTGNPSVHFAFEVAGYVAAAVVYTILRQRRGDTVTDQTRAFVLFGAALGAAIGTRLLAWLADPSQNFFGGKTVVGGLLGGLIGVELAKWIIGVKRSTGDLLVLPTIIAMCIGRIGCFLAGPMDRTTGDPTNLPWGIAIADGVRRHPVALYEIAFLLVLGMGLRGLAVSQSRSGAPRDRETSRPRNPQWREGDQFRLFLSSYLAFRLAVDFIKPEPPPLLLGMSAIQWACVAGLLYYALVFSNDQRHASVSLLRRRRVDLHDVLPQD
jgi:phosphatidylglycerol---prolipoprotein diacylglyceryl transferase